MVRKLQFADDINQDFGSVRNIVNFICENLADAEDTDSSILIPLSVKEAMKNGLQVRDGEFSLYVNVFSFLLRGRIEQSSC